MNIGVDNYMRMIPEQFLPGIGLRPGRERPDLEDMICRMYLSMYSSIAAHCANGLNIIADVGHHDDYATGMRMFERCMDIIADYDVLKVGVYCPLDCIVSRRIETSYPAMDGDEVARPVINWQQTIHTDKRYDLTVDTSAQTPNECMELIKQAWIQLKKRSL